MIGYVTIGTNDFEKAKKFYDELLGVMGGKRAFDNDHLQGYAGGGGGMLAVAKPHDGNPATAGNGTMLALNASSQETVDKVHAKALSLGCQDEGAPGPRGDTGFYGAYFRDLDGNKLCVFHMGG